MMNALRKRFAITLVGMMIAQIATAATYIVLARTAGPSAYGHAMAAVGIAGALVALLDFGSAALHLRTAHRMHSSGADDTDIRLKTHEWVTQRALIALASSLILGALMAALGNTFFGAAAANLLALALSSITQSAYQAGQRFTAASISTAVERLAWLGMTLALALSGATLHTCLTVAPLLATVGAFASLVPNDGYLFQGLHRALHTNPWCGTFHFGVNSVAVGMLSLDVSLVRTFSSPLAAGEFAAVNKWAQPFNVLSTAYSRSTFPHLVSANRNEALRALRAGTPFLIGATALAAGLAATSPLLVPALLGDGYGGSVGSFALLMLSVPSMMMNQPLGLFLQSQGREKTSSRIVITSIAWQLIAVALLSSRFGSTGAAFGFSCGQYALTAALITAIRYPAVTVPRVGRPARNTSGTERASAPRSQRTTESRRSTSHTHGYPSERSRPRTHKKLAGRRQRPRRRTPDAALMDLPGRWGVGAFAWVFIFSEGFMYGVKAVTGLTFLNATYLAYAKFAAALVFIVLISSIHPRRNTATKPRPNMALGAYLLVAISYLLMQSRMVEPSPVPLFIQYTLAIALPAVALGSAVKPSDLLRAAPFGTLAGFATLILFIPASLHPEMGESVVNIGLNDVGGASHLMVGQTATVSLVAGLSLATLKSKKLTMLTIGNSLLAIYLIISSGSRGGLASAAVAAPILLWLTASTPHKISSRHLSRARVVALTVGVIVLGATSVKSIGSTSEATKKFTSIVAGGDQSTQLRQQYYESSWAAIQQHPLLGSGPASFARSMGEYLYPHQVFLETWADFGVLGLLIGCTLVVGALRRGIRQGLAGTLVTGQLVASIVMLQFSGTFTTSYLMWFFLACAYTNSVVTTSGGAMEPREPRISRRSRARRLY